MATTVTTLTFNRLPELIRKLPKEVAEIVEEAALDIERTTKVGMAASPSPSVPGDYPGIDMGNLVNSITTAPENPTTFVVQTPVEYAPYLEFGTVNMLPRPFFGQAASAVEPDFIERMSRLESRLR